jgi:hypothetical protein
VSDFLPRHSRQPAQERIPHQSKTTGNRLAHTLCVQGVIEEATAGMEMLKLVWMAHRNAYAVYRDGRILGTVRFGYPIPFRQIIEIV